MDIDKYEMGFFNHQITLAVASLGFEQPDVDFTLTSLEKVFSTRCSPPATVIPADAGPQLQEICGAPNCPLDPNANCAAYPDGEPEQQPVIANATLLGNVTKENEAAAATTAVWPAHCVYKREGVGTMKEKCASETAATATGTQSNGGDSVGGDGRSSTFQWAIGMVIAGIFWLV